MARTPVRKNKRTKVTFERTSNHSDTVRGNHGMSKKGLLYVRLEDWKEDDQAVWVKRFFRLCNNVLYQSQEDTKNFGGSFDMKEYRACGSSTSFDKERLLRPNGEYTSLRYIFRVEYEDSRKTKRTLFLAARTKLDAEQWCKALHVASQVARTTPLASGQADYQSPLARVLPVVKDLWQRGLKRVRPSSEGTLTRNDEVDLQYMSPATATSHYKSLRRSTKKSRVIPSQETLDLAVQLGQVLESAGGNDWRQVRYENGVRVLLEGHADQSTRWREPFGVVKSSVIVRTSPSEVFRLIKEIGSGQQFNWDYSIRSAEVVEVLDDDSDVIQIRYRTSRLKGSLLGVWSVPMLVTPRDICIRRFWREDEDGTFSLSYHSVEHEKCPPVPGYTRAWVYGGGFTIAPRTSGLIPNGIEECLVSHVLHIDARGWSQFWGSPVFDTGIEWLRPFFSSLAGLRDFVEQRQFLSEHLNDTARAIARIQTPKHPSRKLESTFEDHAEMHQGLRRDLMAEMEKGSTEELKPCGSLQSQMWMNSRADFRVRGTSYLQDKKKIPSLAPIMEIFAVDLFEFPKPEEHIAKRAESAIHQVQLSEERPLFIVNFMVPGPPHMSVALYMKLKEEHSLVQSLPPILLLREFLDGDDRYRDTHFKIIPKVVQGSWVVKQGVGNSPAVVGLKLRQSYHRGPGYIEVDVDIGSSSVAGAILHMVSGISKKLVLDIAFLFEGDKEEHLPERVLAAGTFYKVDFSMATKLPSMQSVNLQELRKHWRTPRKALRPACGSNIAAETNTTSLGRLDQ